MKSPKLATLEAWLIYVPLLEEWASSPEFGPHLDSKPRLILKITDENGHDGWGEGSAALSPEQIGATLSQVAATPFEELRPQFLDIWTSPPYFALPQPPSPYAANSANLTHRLRHPLQVTLEMALLDLLARRAGVPLHTLFGGAWRDRILVDYWAGRVTPAHAVRCVERGRSLGFSGIKIKTTLEDPNIERLEAIKDAGGSQWSVTVDPNGRFYRLDDALPTILAMDEIGVMKILEDPFPRFDLDAFSALRPRLKARLVLHIDPPELLFQAMRSGAVGGLNLDSHAQGLSAWRFQAAAAAQANLPVWHGSGLDLGIATAAQLHLAASAPNCQLPGDQAGPWLREASLLQKPLEVENGHILLSRGHGLGIEIDQAQVDHYATQHWLFKG